MTAQREWFEKDYYAVLGVPKGATDKEITRAYRKLAKQYHPDANPGDAAAEERFKEVSHAHDVLSDAEKRREYDAERQFARMGGGFILVSSTRRVADDYRLAGTPSWVSAMTTC